MTISYVGGAAGTNSCTLPSFESGDVAVAFAFRDGSATNPTIASGWTNLTNTTDGTSCSISIGWRRLVVGDTTTGTWTNASRMSVLVYRGCEPFITPCTLKTAAAGTTHPINYAAASMTRSDGTSWLCAFVGHRSIDVTCETAPSGMTNRAAASGVDATAEADAHDTNGGVSSWSSTNVTVTGTASGWQTDLVELLALPAQLPCDLNMQPAIPAAGPI